MVKVEERLAEYRAAKAKEYNSSKNINLSFATAKRPKKPSILSRVCSTILNFLRTNEFTKRIGNRVSTIPLLGWPTFLKFVLWVLLFGFFIELEFGTVFLLLSSFYFIYANTGTRKKLKGEPSAYSVFNENCERLQGSLTAEQFESEIRYGSLQ